jgi:hypothetical protein
MTTSLLHQIVLLVALFAVSFARQEDYCSTTMALNKTRVANSLTGMLVGDALAVSRNKKILL